MAEHEGTLRRIGARSWECLECFATGSHPCGATPLTHDIGVQRALEPSVLPEELSDETEPEPPWSIETQFDTQDEGVRAYTAREIQPMLKALADKLDLCDTGAVITIKVVGNSKIKVG